MKTDLVKLCVDLTNRLFIDKGLGIEDRDTFKDEDDLKGHITELVDAMFFYEREFWDMLVKYGWEHDGVIPEKFK